MKRSVPSDAKLFSKPVVIVSAHPDDEVIGLGTRLAKFKRLRAIVHVTDGAPRNGADAGKAGVQSWKEYADLRRREFEAMLTEAGARPFRILCLGCPDQQASYRIVENARKLAALFLRYRPEYVITHTYEGGHPDHDSIAASVYAAAQLLKARNVKAPALLEYASYHASTWGIENECFLPRRGAHIRHKYLTQPERERKQQLFDCYASQLYILQYFPKKDEPLRIAPEYDFSRAPHRGKLFYEHYPWGMSGRRWRRLSAKALASLKLPDGER